MLLHERDRTREEHRREQTNSNMKSHGIQNKHNLIYQKNLAFRGLCALEIARLVWEEQFAFDSFELRNLIESKRK